MKYELKDKVISTKRITMGDITVIDKETKGIITDIDNNSDGSYRYLVKFKDYIYSTIGISFWVLEDEIIKF